MSTNYQYDNLSQLLSVLHQVDGNTFDGAAYTVDAPGNRLSKADALGGVTSNSTYDAINQLTQATVNGNTTDLDSYDAVGNRLTDWFGGRNVAQTSVLEVCGFVRRRTADLKGAGPRYKCLPLRGIGMASEGSRSARKAHRRFDVGARHGVPLRGVGETPPRQGRALRGLQIQDFRFQRENLEVRI